MNENFFLTDAQLKEEVAKCEFCEEKPCKVACPSNCSPADFIMAVKCGRPSDFERAAYEIVKNNPLGEICGLVCPDTFCMNACVHKNLTTSVRIPAVQAAILKKARELNLLKKPITPKRKNKRVAIIGAGPAGFAAATFLAQKGCEVKIFEKSAKVGGTCHLIPEDRLPREVLEEEMNYLLSFELIQIETGQCIESIESLIRSQKKLFDAVLVTTGLSKPYKLPVKGQEFGILFPEFLINKKKFPCKGEHVAVIGGGAAATDCAVVAKTRGAVRVEMFVLETLSEMPLTDAERHELLSNQIEISSRIKILAITKTKGKKLSLDLVKVQLTGAGKEGFKISNLRDEKGTEHTRHGFDKIIFAIGSAREEQSSSKAKNVFYAGDYGNGPTTVVEAVASGKNAAGKISAFLEREKAPEIKKDRKSIFSVNGFIEKPVDLTTDFFGRSIKSPFLLSAAPPTDGYEQMKKAYRAGWPGGIMKTAFDNIPIHIPSEYMFSFSESTYGNCDNVSGHSLKRVCGEIERLIKEFPDHLTMASTGGPVSGRDEEDKLQWQKNTKTLENAGAMGIEYSLSCPQGGDGTEGDIVSQNAGLTAKIIDWILETGDPNIPKLFKLTAAVTSIKPIVASIKKVFEQFPRARVGITLANTFPVMGFREYSESGENVRSWDEGVVVGMSGEGVIPISYLTLAQAVPMGIVISGNGGPMDYLAAAHFLALGVGTVQFCTIAMKNGYHIIRELESGLSYLLKYKNMASINDLIGVALPKPITEFMELSSLKKISDCKKELCLSCGNCTRCSYLAIELDEEKKPITDASKCVGCSICVKKCFAKALFMRDRTKTELKALKEH